MDGSRFDPKRFDLNLLVVLDALLAERHVTRAGRRLHLTQSATSAALRRLRRLLDDPLLVPQGRELQLTPLARSLQQPVRDVLQRIDDLTSDHTALDAGLRGRTFIVQASEYVALVLLGPVIEKIHQSGTGARIRIEPLGDDFADRLHRNDIDLVVAPMHSLTARRVRQFPHEILFQDELVAAVWREHAEIGDRLSADDLARVPILDHVVRGDEESGSLVVKELAARDVPHTVVASTGSYTLLPFLLRGSQLLGFLPCWLGELLAEPAQLRLLRSPVPLPPLVETMYWHPDHDRSDPAHAWLRHQLRAQAAAHEDRAQEDRGEDRAHEDRGGATNVPGAPMTD